jgi:DNA-binding NarL/FixJ family response regulator
MNNNLRVLYFESDSGSAALGDAFVDLEMIDAIPAKSISDAWQLAQTSQFDLYLFEFALIDVNGTELLRSLRYHSPHTPIVCYSNACVDELQDELFSESATLLIEKPGIGEFKRELNAYRKFLKASDWFLTKLSPNSPRMRERNVLSRTNLFSSQRFASENN